jgi:hypothetical protein
MILMLLLGVFLPCYLYDEDLGLEKFKDFYCFFWGGGRCGERESGLRLTRMK